MTQDRYDLSRRKILAGLGTVGVASAGAGLGTSAFLSDTERFESNTMTAGNLDLKLDYKATYAGGPGRLDEVDSWYSESGPGEPFDVEEIEDGRYLIGEVPNATDDIWAEEVQNTDLCDPSLNLVNGDDIPVFTLEDVKPGDSGEVTVSLHVCTNPAWIYMNGELTENDENNVNEAEAESNDENNDQTDSEIEGDGELADSIETTLWYDENCNNVLDGEGDETESTPVCVQLVLDDSGSMGGDRIENTKSGAKQLAETVLDANEDNMVGVSRYDGSASTPEGLTDDLTAINTAIDGLSAGGSTDAQAGVDAGQAELENCPEDHDRIMVAFGDGDINTNGQDAKDDGIEIFAIGVGGASEDDLDELASEPVDEHVFIGADDDAIEQLFSQVGETITGSEEIILQDTLANVMDDLEEGIALDGDRSSEERDPFAAAMTHCLGFKWDIPEDVGNEIQSDSVGFDLGFYAIQSRHNEDPPENPFNETDENGTTS